MIVSPVSQINVTLIILDYPSSDFIYLSLLVHFINDLGMNTDSDRDVIKNCEERKKKKKIPRKSLLYR